MQKIKPKCTGLTDFLAFPFITESALTALQEEFPKYAAIAEDVSNEFTVLNFGKAIQKNCPNWEKLLVEFCYVSHPLQLLNASSPL